MLSNGTFSFFVVIYCFVTKLSYYLLKNGWLPPLISRSGSGTVVRTYFPLYDCSLLLRSVHELFLRTMWLYFFNTIQFGSQPHRIYKPENQKAEKAAVVRKTLGYLISPRLLCLKTSPQRNQLISYPSRCVEDRSPQEKKKTSVGWITLFLTKWKVTNAILLWCQSLNKMQQLWSDTSLLNSIQGIF